MGYGGEWLKKTSMRKNLTSGIDEKNPPRPRWKWRRKLKRTIDKKSPNLPGTAEENRNDRYRYLLLVPRHAISFDKKTLGPRGEKPEVYLMKDSSDWPHA